MKNIIISLDSANKRRQHIENEFGKHQLSYEFFDALRPEQAAQYAKSLNLEDTSDLTPTELACMMSHVAVWEKIIAEQLDYVAIFEDDVYLGEDAGNLLNSTDWIHPDWHIIKIEAFAKKTYLGSKTYEVLANKRHVTQLKGKNLGTAGYILSKKGAIIYLDYIKSQVLVPLDIMMFDNFIRQGSEPIQQLVPALCIQEMILHKNNPSLPSALLKERKDRMRAEKKKGLAKVNKEASRLLTQAKKTLFAKEVPFK
ncbi:glycosyltransferase family 25 protein [Psychrobacter raelei]|uniref:Glycosyltransferase family 25 protein n=1 Tax=Psychrobacter raelei TaxID=2565531 RepID=A0AAU6PWF5_9GAMM